MYNHGVWIGFQIAPENKSIDLIKDCASDIVALFLVSFRTAGDIDIHVCFFCKFWSTVSKCSSSKNDYPKGLMLSSSCPRQRCKCGFLQSIVRQQELETEEFQFGT